jgi:hypothetical protein
LGSEESSPFPPQFEGNAYVALFRYGRMLKDFITAFVEIGPLRDTLDFERAELLEREFITEELREFMPDFRFHLVDLGRFDEEELAMAADPAGFLREKFGH